MRIYFLVLFGCMLMGAVWPTIVTAQEREKQKPGTTVDTWRKSLPPEAETSRPAEEIPGDAALPSRDETRKVLLSLEKGLMEALKVRDADSLSQIIGSEFTFANPRLAGISDRSTYLGHVVRDLKLTSYQFDKTTVRVFGRTAIFSSLLKQSATVAGEDWSGTYLLTDVWISRDGIWRVVSRHESLLQNPIAPPL